MPLDFNFMVGGEAGQGVQTMGLILARSMMRGGFEVFADQDYESRVRGGHNFFRVRVRDVEVKALSEPVDVLIALNKETIDLHRAEMKPDGAIVFDKQAIKSELPDSDLYLNVPLESLAVEAASNKVMSNMVAVGASFGLVDYDFEILAGVLGDVFGKDGKEIVEGNVRAARAGYGYAAQHRSAGFTRRIAARGRSKKLLMTGNEALALGALAAGCRFVAGYPMTPTTSILEFFAEKGKPFGAIMVQPEDEISAMNMVVGAGYAGARAMTATSGGGFCLMTEALSLAGMTETPCVVVLGQRPGPAIGLPTRQEQGELLFAINGGHGEFPRAVLAPATVEDAFPTVVRAFNLAERYQTPVIVITDHHLATSYSTVDKFELSKVRIDRGALLSEAEARASYKRYLITESGVSPRAIPTQGKALVVSDSDEHNEEGHIIEDAETRNRMVMKRMRKLDGLRREMAYPLVEERPGAEMVLVGWGSTHGAIKEAARILEGEGIRASVLHLTDLWPFPAEAVAEALGKARKSIVVENNATGQLAQLISAETGIRVSNTVLRFDGRPISPQYVLNGLKKEVA